MDLKQLNVVLLGLAFHLIFFSFQTAVFVQQTVVNSLVNKPGSEFTGNAYTGLCVTYTVFALANWLAPSMIALTGVKLGMIAGACTYVLYSASFLYPTNWLYYTAAALIGLGAAPLWTAQGAFLAKQSDPTTSSKNAGIFWVMLQSSLLLGNLFVYFTFSETSTKSTGTNLVSNSTTNQLISVTSETVVSSLDQLEQSPPISDRTRHVLYGVLTLVCALGTIVLMLLRDGSPAELAHLKAAQVKPKQINNLQSAIEHRPTNICETNSALSQFLGAIKLAKTSNMLLLSVVFFFTGQLLSFFTGIYSTAIGATSQFGVDSKKFIGLAGIAIGAGEIVAGAVFGLLGSRCLANRIRAGSIFVLGYMILLGALVLTFVNLPPDSSLPRLNIAQEASIIEPRLSVVLLTSILIGSGDACFNTQVYAMLMSVYRDNSVPAFALFKFTQSLGSAAAFLYSNKLDLHCHIAILVVMSTLAAVCFCIVDRQSPNDATLSQCSSAVSSSLSSLPDSIIAKVEPTMIEKSESRQCILDNIL